MQYTINEGQLELPPGYLDASVNTLAWDVDGAPVRLFVSRAPHEGRDLAAIVEDRMADMRRRLSSFELLERTERAVAGQKGLEAAMTFREANLAAYQRIAFFLVEDKFVALGVRGSDAARAAMDKMFERAVSTATVRKKDEGGSE